MPKKKKFLVYLEIDDEVTTAIDKIKRKRSKEIFLVVPNDAIIFQSIVNLQILLKTVKDKKLKLITSDLKGLHLAEKLGIEVFDIVNEDGQSALFASKSDNPHLQIMPLKASVNSVIDDTPLRRSEKKIAIAEALRHPSGYSNKKISKKPNIQKKTEVRLSDSSKRGLFALLSISGILLMFILYVALPSAKIYITPTATKLEKSVNITFADSMRNQALLATKPTNTIASYTVETTVSETITHKTDTREIAEGFANASGVITVFNKTENNWDLVKNTRFQTEDGLVFRSQANVTIPAATAASPGKFDVFVVADEYDANGLLVGERGNIEASQFFLPGLSEASQELVYGESTAAMSGGVSEYISIVREEDIENAITRIEKRLEEQAKEVLLLALEEEAKKTGIDGYAKLLDGQAVSGIQPIKISEVQVDVDNSLIGQNMDEFSISGTMVVRGIFFDERELLNLLEQELVASNSPGKELLELSESNYNYRIFDEDEINKRLKITATIKGVEQYAINEETESGKKLLERIREHIAGLRVEEAEAFMMNLQEINKVNIESWPAWSPTIPKIHDNIEFKVRDAIEI